MKFGILWIIAGIISLIGGIIALGNPLAATLTAEILAGYMFTIVGILTIISAFYEQGWGGRILALLLGVMILAFGINLLAHPLKGILSLTYISAVMMMVMGVLRLLLAFSSAAAGVRVALVISGVLSVALSVMIFSNWPQSAAIVLGLYLAIELISNGVTLITLGIIGRAVEKEEAA